MAARFATLAEVRALSPALSADYPGAPYPDALLTTCLTVAEFMIGLAPWGAEASIGHALLAAHFAAGMAAGAFGPAGPRTSETRNGVTSSYATVVVSDDDLKTTTYGRLYLTMRKLVALRSGKLLVANSTIDQGP